MDAWGTSLDRLEEMQDMDPEAVDAAQSTPH